MKKTFPVLQTTRLILREVQTDDAPILYRYLSDRDVVRYYDPPVTRLEQVQHFIRRYRIRFEDNEAIRWGITVKGYSEVIGTCGYFIDNTNSFATLSYVLDKYYWNKGVMTEALSAVIHYGFTQQQLHRLEAHVAAPNLASAMVLQKLGFREEGVLRERLFEGGRFHDERVFSLLASDVVNRSFL